MFSFSLDFINGQSLEIHRTPGEDQQLSDDCVHVIILFIDYCEMETIFTHVII